MVFIASYVYQRATIYPGNSVQVHDLLHENRRLAMNQENGQKGNSMEEELRGLSGAR